MEPICAIKDIYKILYQFEKNFSEVHAIDRKSTRLNSSHVKRSRMPSSA